MSQHNPNEKIIVALVVDDNAEDLKLIKDYLEPRGYSVLEAATGQDGIQAFRKCPPHVVVLDYVLPDMIGAEVCKQLKSIHSAVPVLMISIRGDVEHKVEAFRSGCDDYMTKPCELEELEIRIKNLLKRSCS